METRYFSSQNPLLQGARQSRFASNFWYAVGSPALFYVLIKVGGYLSKNFQQAVSDIDVGIQDWANILDLLCFSFTLLVFYIWIRFVEGRSFRSIGLQKKDALKEYVRGFAFGTVMLLVVIGLMMLCGVVHFSHFSLNTPTIIAFFFALIGYTIQGSTEEVYSRGWLIPVMGVHVPLWMAIVVSSSFFSVLHLWNAGTNYLSSVNMILFGAIMALYAFRRGDIWGACGLHVAWNFVQGHVFGMNVSGYPSDSSLTYFVTSGTEWLSGGEYGTEASLVSSVVYTLVILYFIFGMKNKPVSSNHTIETTN